MSLKQSRQKALKTYVCIKMAENVHYLLDCYMCKGSYCLLSPAEGRAVLLPFTPSDCHYCCGVVND